VVKFVVTLIGAGVGNETPKAVNFTKFGNKMSRRDVFLVLFFLRNLVGLSAIL